MNAAASEPGTDTSTVALAGGAAAAPQGSLQRVLTALGHQEPDRVPFYLGVTMHGARAMDMSLADYYASPAAVVEGQLRMCERWSNDFVTPFTSASVEHEAFGGSTVVFDDGPPNSGAPVLRRVEDIARLQVPDIGAHAGLGKVLECTAGLAERVGGEVLILGVVVAPSSLPVMQLGFESYLALMFEDPAAVDALLAVNEEFCVAWANAQLAAGANAIGYFDPVSSPTISTRELSERWGIPAMRRCLARIEGPCAALYASGRTGPIVGDDADAGAVIVGVSNLEDVVERKQAANGRITVMGNLNALAMRRWSPEEAERQVRRALRAAPGGGFILADAHGEIPWQVDEEILDALAAAVNRWGRYPLDWLEDADDLDGPDDRAASGYATGRGNGHGERHRDDPGAVAVERGDTGARGSASGGRGQDGGDPWFGHGFGSGGSGGGESGRRR